MVDEIDEDEFIRTGKLPFKFAVKITIIVMAITGILLLLGAIENGFSLKIALVWLAVSFVGFIALVFVFRGYMDRALNWMCK